MSAVLIATAVVAVIGFVIGIALVAAGKKFHVEVDEREAEVRSLLPGNNCGACGFAGCDAMAAAIVKGETAVGSCPVCSGDAVKAIGKVMGVEAEASARRVAFVRCSGSCEKSPEAFTYVGVRDCRTAALSGVPARACSSGCLGFGSCAAACPHDAIQVRDGVAVVLKNRCLGCGLCAAACPKNLITLIPVGKANAVRCSSHERGPAVKKVCSAGCLGCGICAKQCPEGAITVQNNLASIDPAKCVGCGKCEEKCPAKVIVSASPGARV